VRAPAALFPDIKLILSNLPWQVRLDGSLEDVWTTIIASDVSGLLRTSNRLSIHASVRCVAPACTRTSSCMQAAFIGWGFQTDGMRMTPQTCTCRDPHDILTVLTRDRFLPLPTISMADLHGLLTAQVFIMSRSAFSYVPALFSRAEVIVYPRMPSLPVSERFPVLSCVGSASFHISPRCDGRWQCT
jgi:hypothetical protein